MKKALLFLIPLFMFMSCDLIDKEIETLLDKEQEETQDKETQDKETEATYKGTWVGTYSDYDEEVNTNYNYVIYAIFTEDTLELISITTSSSDDPKVQSQLEQDGLLTDVSRSKGTFTVKDNKIVFVLTHEYDDTSNKYIDITTTDDYDLKENTEVFSWEISNDKLIMIHISGDGGVKLIFSRTSEVSIPETPKKPETPAYIGTWLRSDNIDGNGLELLLTESSFEVYAIFDDFDGNKVRQKQSQGNLIVTNNSITLNQTHSYDSSNDEYVEEPYTIKGTWSVSGDKLHTTLTDENDMSWTDTFTKKDESIEPDTPSYVGTWVKNEMNNNGVYEEMVISPNSITNDFMEFSIENIDDNTIKITIIKIYDIASGQWKTIDESVNSLISQGFSKDHVEEYKNQFAPQTVDWSVENDTLTITHSEGSETYTRK